MEKALSLPVGYNKRDLSGQIFGRLTAEYKIAKTNKWHCLCVCGNECDVDQYNLLFGRQLSCGCLNNERRHEKHKDKAGSTINGVKLLYRTEDEIDSNGTHYIHYMCVCPFCGKEFDARYHNITTGNTKGCGCTRYQYTNHIDLTGKDFEFCHVDKRIENQIQPSGGYRVMYECTCICGNKFTDWAYTIMHGRSNCGCKRITSKGECKIREWLDNRCVSYTTQFWFDDLRGEYNKPLFFDFALYDEDNNLLGLIEFQGEQHYHEVKTSIKNFGKKQREVTDPMKREYCKKNNIKLFEISYLDSVKSKCEEIYKLLYHDNTVPSSQETA